MSSDEIVPSPPYRKDVSCNAGEHVLHMGGRYDAWIPVPVIPAREAPRGAPDASR